MNTRKDAQKNNAALHTLTMRRSDVAKVAFCCGLGGDRVMDEQQMVSWTDGQTDGGINNIPIVFLKRRGDNKALFSVKKCCYISCFCFEKMFFVEK